MRVYLICEKKKKREKNCEETINGQSLSLSFFSCPPARATTTTTSSAAAPRHHSPPPLASATARSSRLLGLPGRRRKDVRAQDPRPKLEDPIKHGQEQQQQRRVVPGPDQQRRRRHVDRVVHRRRHTARLGQVAAAVEERARGRVEDGLGVLLEGEQAERGDEGRGGEGQEVAPEGLWGRRAEEARVDEGGLLVKGGGQWRWKKRRRGGERERKRRGRPVVTEIDRTQSFQKNKTHDRNRHERREHSNPLFVFFEHALGALFRHGGRGETEGGG